MIKRNWVCCKNSGFLISIYLQPNITKDWHPLVGCSFMDFFIDNIFFILWIYYIPLYFVNILYTFVFCEYIIYLCMFLCQECFHNIPRIPAEQLIIFTKKQYSRLRRHFRFDDIWYWNKIYIKMSPRKYKWNIYNERLLVICWIFTYWRYFKVIQFSIYKRKLQK